MQSTITQELTRIQESLLADMPVHVAVRTMKAVHPKVMKLWRLPRVSSY